MALSRAFVSAALLLLWLLRNSSRILPSARRDVVQVYRSPPTSSSNVSLALRLGSRCLDMTPLANNDGRCRAAEGRCDFGYEGCVTCAKPTAPGAALCAIEAVFVRAVARADGRDIAAATAGLGQSDS